MTINTNVSTLLNNPQTFHDFTYAFAVPGLTPLPLRIALIGMMMSTGTGVAGTVYEPADAIQADTLFGVGSELALMYRKAVETAGKLQKGPRISCVGVAEPGAGTANVKTLTVTGTATADGNALISIAGRQFAVGIRSGDVQNTVATAISNVLKASLASLPVAVSVAANVVTLTHNTKGVNGVDVALTVDQVVAGSAIAAANTAVGAGVASPQTAIDALAPLPFDGIALANHAAADITIINTDIASRWNNAEKRWRWYFLGEMGSIGTATSLATSANHQAVVINSFEGCLNTAGEMAAALAVGAFSRDRPNANYDGLELPLFPPPVATIYTPTEVETAIAAGLTPMVGKLDPTTRALATGVAKVVRMVTTKTTQGSAPFAVLRDLAVSRTGVYLAQQYDVAYQQRFSADANPDGTLLTDDVQGQVKDMVENINRLAQTANILRNVDADLQKLKVEPDGTVSGRLNIEVVYTVVVGLHQIAFAHRVQI